VGNVIPEPTLVDVLSIGGSVAMVVYHADHAAPASMREGPVK
jgi:hypothetical protein